MSFDKTVFNEVYRALDRPQVKNFTFQWANLLKSLVGAHGFESDHKPLWSTVSDPDGRAKARWTRRWGDPLMDTHFYVQADFVIEVVQVLGRHSIIQDMLSAKLQISFELLSPDDYSATYESPAVRVFMGTLEEVDTTVGALIAALRSECLLSSGATELSPVLQSLVQSGLQELDALRTP